MKTDQLFTMISAGVLTWVAVKWLAGKKTAGGGTVLVANYSNTDIYDSSFARSIANAATDGQAGYGWQYFTDGTAIAPNGDYYHQGVLVSKA